MFKSPWGTGTYEHHVVGHRLSRIAFGAVLIAGTCALAIAAATQHGDTIRIIVSTWIAGGLAAAVARRHVPAHPNHDALGVASLVVPIVGLFLIGPLSLHLLVVALICVLNPGADLASGFDTWVAMSFVCVGLAHIVGAASAAVRAVQLARGLPAWSPSRVFCITVGASLLPGGLLVFPPFLVAITGLPFVIILHAMERIAKRERIALEGLAAHLPIAIARSA